MLKPSPKVKISRRRVFTQSLYLQLYLYSQQCWAPAAPPGVVLVAP